MDAPPAVIVTPEMIRFNVPNGVKFSDELGFTGRKGNKTLDAFGQAFSAASGKWTRELCLADSDGDGQTNGMELGDPCCKWTTGTAAASTMTSNPGNPHSKLRNAPTLKELCHTKSRKNGHLHHT